MKIIENYYLEDFNELFIDNINYQNREQLIKTGKYEIGNGLIESSDLIIYMAKSHDNYFTIFDEDLNNESYRKLLLKLKKYFYIKPLYVFQINRIIKKYSYKNGKKLHLMKNNWKWNEDSVYEYIKSGIFSNSPVLMINWRFNTKNNWNLIIGLRKFENNSIEIVLYSGNEILYLNLNDWINKKCLYRGLLYYK